MPLKNWRSMAYSTNFSMALQTEIFPTETSDFLKQIIILNLFNSMLYVKRDDSD